MRKGILMNRADAFTKYLAPKRHMPREYKDNRVGDCGLGAGALARIVLERLAETGKVRRYLVVIDIDGGCYVLSHGSRVREFVDLHTNLVVGMYDSTVHVDDLVSDLEMFLQEAA